MAIRSRDELINAVSAFLGEEPDETGIELLEDVTDTLDDYVLKTSDQTDWKAKYEENDAAWKRKYVERFSRTDDPGEGDTEIFVEEGTEVTAVDESPQTYEDLFRTESEV